MTTIFLLFLLSLFIIFAIAYALYGVWQAYYESKNKPSFRGALRLSVAIVLLIAYTITFSAWAFGHMF